jgi:hypothetical protein
MPAHLSGPQPLSRLGQQFRSGPRQELLIRVVWRTALAHAGHDVFAALAPRARDIPHDGADEGSREWRRRVGQDHVSIGDGDAGCGCDLSWVRSLRELAGGLCGGARRGKLQFIELEPAPVELALT